MSEKLHRLFRTRSVRLIILAAIFGAAIVWLPRWAVSAMVVLALLGLVAKYDNRTGTFLPLAILIVIVIIILLVLLGTMAAMHR